MATKPIFVLSANENSTKLYEQILRLKHYIGLLRQEAQYLGNGLAGELADALQKIADSSDLEAITEALLTITNKEVKVDGNIVADGTEVTASQEITISKGYYNKDTTLTVQSLADSSAVDDAPAVDEVVAGKDYWVNGEKKVGTLVDNSGETVDVTSTDKATAKDGDTITAKIPKAKYTEDSVIDTGIVARTTYAYNADVTVSRDAEGNDHATLASFDIPAGYYNSPITITQRFLEGADNYESVINIKDFVVSASGEYDPHTENYDYYSKVTIAQAAIASAATLDIPTAKATVSVTTKGFTDEDSYVVTLPTKTAPSAVDGAASTETANVTVTAKVAEAQTVTVPAGLYTQDTVIKVNSMASGETLNSDNIAVKDTPTVNEAGDGFTVTVTVDKSGYIPAGDYTASDLAKSKVTTTNITDDVITANTITVSTNEGYTKGENHTYTVQDAEFDNTIGVAQNKLTITPTKDGWFTGKEYNLAGKVNALVDVLATTSDAEFVYDDVKALANGKNTTKYPGGEGVYYKKATTDLTALVSELAAL